MHMLDFMVIQQVVSLLTFLKHSSQAMFIPPRRQVRSRSRDSSSPPRLKLTEAAHVNQSPHRAQEKRGPNKLTLSPNRALIELRKKQAEKNLKAIAEKNQDPGIAAYRERSIIEAARAATVQFKLNLNKALMGEPGSQIAGVQIQQLLPTPSTPAGPPPPDQDANMRGTPAYSSQDAPRAGLTSRGPQEQERPQQRPQRQDVLATLPAEVLVRQVLILSRQVALTKAATIMCWMIPVKELIISNMDWEQKNFITRQKAATTQQSKVDLGSLHLKLWYSILQSVKKWFEKDEVMSGKIQVYMDYTYSKGDVYPES